MGASYFEALRSNGQTEVNYQRIMFLLCFVVFVTSFAYVLVLGVHNVLRYYYIQNLEDELHKLNPSVSDADGQGSLLHWNAFLAPIITRNPHHIKSYYTAAVFICYSVAATGVVVFCAALAFTLYMQITPKNIFDRIIAGVFIFIAALEILLFS